MQLLRCLEVLFYEEVGWLNRAFCEKIIVFHTKKFSHGTQVKGP